MGRLDPEQSGSISLHNLLLDRRDSGGGGGGSGSSGVGVVVVVGGGGGGDLSSGSGSEEGSDGSLTADGQGWEIVGPASPGQNDESDDEAMQPLLHLAPAGQGWPS